MALLEEQGYDFVATRPTVKQTFVHRSLLNDAERADRLLSAA